MWPGCFCVIHSDQHEIQRVRFNDGRVMWMSLHYEAPESNPCTHSLTHGLELHYLRPSNSHKRANERGDERKRSEKSGTAAQQMQENDTLGYFYIHISKRTQRCGEPLHTQQYVIWALNEPDRQIRTCWLRSIFCLSKPESRVSMGFWIQVIVSHWFDFRHMASL